MDALLDGTPQFVVAAISALITSNQATNVARIEELFRRQLVRPTGRARFQWNLMLTGWWLIALTAVAAFVRIGLGAVVSDSKTHPVFIILDLGLVSSMGLGYFCFAITGFLAWRAPQIVECHLTRLPIYCPLHIYLGDYLLRCPTIICQFREFNEPWVVTLTIDPPAYTGGSVHFRGWSDGEVAHSYQRVQLKW